MKLAIVGAAGRMGRTLVAIARREPDLEVVAAVEQEGHAELERDAGELAGIGAIGVPLRAALDPALAVADAVIDFSHAGSTLGHLEACRRHGRALVLGTTGLDPAGRAAVARAAEEIPIVSAPNMSLGVNLSFRLVELAARALGEEFDIEIIEAHHRYKVDAPSGTALRLGEIAARARGIDLERGAVYGRQGQIGAREQRSIGYATVRGGDIVGDHTVLFAGDGERVEITHRASSRESFARGALRAARWLRGRSAGLYDMQDVLGLGA